MIDAIQLIPQSSQHFARPSIISSYFSKNHRCSLLICNRIRLLLHCSDLQGHTYMFNDSSADSTCLLCLSAAETTHHYLLECPRLNPIRQKWLPLINPDTQPCPLLPFAWGGLIDNSEIQNSILSFLADLRSYRASLL